MGYWNPKSDFDAMVNIIKIGVKDIHKETDKIFIDQFLRGRVSKKTYSHFMSQIYFIYETMEAEIERNKNNKVIGPIYFPEELNRMESLEEDMEYLYGVGWRNKIKCLKTTKIFVDRLKYLGENQPELLMAHAFTRYMGDLFGGQILKRKWRKMYNFPEDKGVSFYTFKKIESVPKFREFMEMRVNGIELSAEHKIEQLDECKLAFEFHNDFLTEILDMANAAPDGFLPVDGTEGKAPQTWAQECKELGIEEVGGCAYANTNNSSAAQQCPRSDSNSNKQCPRASQQNKGGQCPLNRVAAHSDKFGYGLLACATAVLVYPLLRKALTS